MTPIRAGWLGANLSPLELAVKLEVGGPLDQQSGNSFEESLGGFEVACKLAYDGVRRKMRGRSALGSNIHTLVEARGPFILIEGSAIRSTPPPSAR